MNAQKQLVTYARQIATYRGYTNLINKLQPLSVLYQKRNSEIEELNDALKNKSQLHILHEAADILYYSAAIHEQELEEMQFSNQWNWAQLFLQTYKIVIEHAEIAALVKYNWRASGYNNKNEAYELCIINQAICI